MHPADLAFPHNAVLWQASRPQRARAVLATGHAALDAALADGGWPRGALSELLPDASGSGELALLLPALAAFCAGGGQVVLANPPWLPCAAAWQAAGVPATQLLLLRCPDARQWLWSAEQVARTPGCALLAWQPRQAPAMRELRRLQMAAQAGDGLAVLLRPPAARAASSPAALRLALRAGERGALQVEILKQRGGFGGQAVTLPLREPLARARLAAWQLPFHTEARDDLARPAFPRAAAGALDAQPALPEQRR